LLSVRGLFYSYTHDERYAVKDVSFDVADGEIFGFLGPNGAGKTTAQNILTGLLPLQRGEASVAGEDVRRRSAALYNAIGVAFEYPNLYRKLTGLENLQFFASMYSVPTVDPRRLLQIVGLEDAAGKRVGAYSKGMQQRLVLARSLINRPRLWFLDEPTIGLDPASAQSIRRLILEKKAEGTTIFLTTHDMHVAEELCDRVGFINEGAIVAIDTPRSLKLQYGERVVKVEYSEDGSVRTEYLSMVKAEDRGRFAALVQGGNVETVHSQEASLEDIFIRLTGRGLE